MWILVGATSCHVVFSGGHILQCGVLVGATSWKWVPPPRSATTLFQTIILVMKFNVAKSCLDSWFYQV